MNRRRLILFIVCVVTAGVLYALGFYDQEETKIIVALPAGLAGLLLVFSVFEEIA